MGVYLYPSGTETELKNAYIGEYIEEVFTFAWISGSTTNYKPISKSWYKVEKVIIQSNCIQNASSAWAYFFITSDTTRNYEWQLSFNIGSSNTSTFSGVRYRTGGSNIDEYRINSYVNYTTNNTFTMTFNRTWWELIVNWTTLSAEYSTSMTSVINTIMNSANIQYRQATSYATMWTQTVTVVYSKN